ncbi:sulfate transporter family protein [Colletotrichum incanum]|uniref:Sulfate transporter family protein n=2 Tax=Colletotrichum spaethianum species complex TaxID=2707349 RepID=A0A166L6H9_COLIC|nr:sulfate transporter family protein [Colletotrichum incanum]
MSLRSILGGGRVKKSKPRPKATASASPRKNSGTNSPRAGSGAKRKPTPADADLDDDDDFFHDRLDDVGLVAALASDMSLRDVVQAMKYTRNHMFGPVPTEAAGMKSTRIAEVLNYRKAMPGIVTVSHLHALLASPTAVEREVAELQRGGAVRKIYVPRRGGLGEALIRTSELEEMITQSAGLDQEAKTAFLEFLRENPLAQTMPRSACGHKQADALVRAGFLTASIHPQHVNTPLMNLHSRPEDRGSLMSIEAVSRAASGSFDAVGGQGAVHAAGGGGGPPRSSRADASSSGADFTIAVPGNGSFLKLTAAAVEHLTRLLSKSQFREMPVSMLRERWEGGVARDEARLARRARGEFAGVLPGRTKRWKEFYGLEFHWVLEEAMGAGHVEVFETRSVGRGVRLL